jgi:hypothetical protein
MTERDAHAGSLESLLSLSTPRTDAPTALPDAAEPEVQCPDDPKTTSASRMTAVRPPWATIIDPATLAQAAQRNSTAISSTAGAFFAVAVRRDLLLAPRAERQAILAQARRFTTMGEVGVYCRQVLGEIARHNRNTAERKLRSRRVESR